MPVPYPKPIKKEKVKDPYYWSNLRSKSLKKKMVANKPNQDKLDLWYRKIYDMAGGVCAESGRKVSFSNMCCAHLLPKSKYGYFKFDLRNGILLSREYHAILDKGTASQRRSLKVWEYVCLQRQLLLSEVGLEFDEDYWANMSV